MSRQKVEKEITFMEAKLIFRNFRGDQTPYNRQGERNFCVIFEDPEMAQTLTEDGWLIKVLEPREEGDIRRFYMKVNVSYKNRPPKIVMITSRGKNQLPEDMIEILDSVVVTSADLVVNPYNWEVKGEHGVSGYLKTLYVTIHEDPIDLKYADLEDAPF